MIALQSAFATWDAVGHDQAAYPHGPTGIVVVPDQAAAPLLARGGYRKATAADIGAELAVLEARASTLRSLNF